MRELYKQEVNRCLTCGNSLCKRGCPLNNDFSKIIEYVRRGNYAQAVQEIGHPFGEICGYVCPHEQLCQGACILGKWGKPVLTGTIERELFAEYPYVVERKGTALQDMHYAVIGGGISGLTFATKVYEQGADVIVFERDELLATIKLIPFVRLPQAAVYRAEQSLLNKFKVVRKQIDAETLKSLTTLFDGVYVSTGLTIDYGLGVEGETLATNYRDCLKGKFAKGTVVVVGGGNSAMDCARLAVSKGCRTIVAYRRTEQDMPAFAREIDEAKREGVEFVFNVAPTKLVKEGGRLQLTLARTVSEGRGKLIVTDDEFAIDCDYVVAAIGSKFDKSLLSASNSDEVYSQCSNLYFGGDANGGKLVVDAVADGMRAANTVIQDVRKLCLLTR